MAGDIPRLAAAAPHGKAALWVPARVLRRLVWRGVSWWGWAAGGGAGQAFHMLLATGPRRSS